MRSDSLDLGVDAASLATALEAPLKLFYPEDTFNDTPTDDTPVTQIVEKIRGMTYSSPPSYANTHRRLIRVASC